MPVITIHLVEEKITEKQYREVIAEVTECVTRILGKNPATTHVIINPLPATQWGIGGISVRERRQAAPKAKKGGRSGKKAGPA